MTRNVVDNVKCTIYFRFTT